MGDKVVMKEVDPSTQELITSQFKGYEKFARFGDIGCLMPVAYKQDADNYKNMTIRPDDVWVATFPRSGTTWASELVWLVMNNLDYDTASQVPLTARCMFLEMIHLGPDGKEAEKIDPATLEVLSTVMHSYESITNAPSPRCIKTHMPFSLLPANLLETAKVVYVARDPRDVAVSYYHHNRLFMHYSGDFKTYWNLFIQDLVVNTPFFPHLKEAWALRDHPNMLFIFYEDMIKDLPSVIKRIANFLGKEVTDEQIKKLQEHLDIKNFRKNESVNPSWMNKVGNQDAEGFVRKGKSGGWHDHFDEEMAAQAQKWIRENLRGSDLRFPDASSKVASLVSQYNKR